MIDFSLIDKVASWLFKPLILLVKYVRSRPDIRLSFNSVRITPIGEGSSVYQFLWDMTLIIHNDSDYLARGIKQLSKPPSGWAIFEDFPTRLEPDQVIKLPMRASWREEQEHLVKRFGTSSQANMLPDLQAEVFAHFELTISFLNQYGRQFHQKFTWCDGVIQSCFLKGAK